MSTSVMSDAMVMPVIELESQTVTSSNMNNNNNNNNNEEKTEIECANCDCCGLTEECTRAYMERIKQRHQGKWICGLCSEAVKDEMVRSQKLISCEEAMTRHASFCKASRSPGPPPNPAIHLIAAMRKMLMRRTTSSPRSMPSSPMNYKTTESVGLFRSESCMPTLTLTVESSSSNESEEEEHGDDS